MRPNNIVRIVAVAGLIVFAYWFATHTYWADERVPISAHGDALRDPFYVAERLTRALGAHASEERVWKLPPQNAVLVTGLWDESRSSAQTAQLERWVESGGRLVVDFGYSSHGHVFSDWSGITRRYPKGKPQGCPDGSGVIRIRRAVKSPIHATVCEGYAGGGYLVSTRAPDWKVTDARGAQALRIKAGRGSVTVVNGEPFTYTALLWDKRSPALFVAATQLHAGDDFYFLSDEIRASLMALAWEFGAPVVVLLLAALGLALWRAAPRFGPAVPSPESARRSLAEQIRGTGRFLLRTGDGQALHGAAVRALFAAAPRRISAFATLSSADRLSGLARVTGFPADAVAAAVNYTGARRVNELRSAIALLEAARREIIRNNSGSTDGN